MFLTPFFSLQLNTQLLQESLIFQLSAYHWNIFENSEIFIQVYFEGLSGPSPQCFLHTVCLIDCPFLVSRLFLDVRLTRKGESVGHTVNRQKTHIHIVMYTGTSLPSAKIRSNEMKYLEYDLETNSYSKGQIRKPGAFPPYIPHVKNRIGRLLQK